MKDDGVIKSENFTTVCGNSPGFMLKAADGYLEAIGARFKNINVYAGVFNNITVNNGVFSGSLSAATGTFSGSLSAATGTFKGTLNAATIDAKTISLNGAHASGTGYVIAGDNRNVTVYETASQQIKKLIIKGTGSCVIRISVRGTFSVSKYGQNSGSSTPVYQQNYDTTQTTDFSNIALDSSGTTTFILFGNAYTGGGGSSTTFTNTTFEIRCAGDPGLYRYLSG